MCGIFFMLSDQNDTTKLEDLSLKSQSRGPENTSEVILTSDGHSDDIYISFHRLSINGLDEISNQPFYKHGIYLICNGEIYNSDYLWSILGTKRITNSDCEVIIEMYKYYGIEYTLNVLDGVFAFVLYDTTLNKIIVARDPFGVRPMFELESEIAFASELKQLSSLGKCRQFTPGTFCTIEGDKREYKYYFTQVIGCVLYQDYHSIIYSTFRNSIDKRTSSTDRQIGCLLSGGLDSSVVAALVRRNVPELNTFSIGLEGSPDILNARIVAKHINSIHHELILSEKDFLEAIPKVIEIIESYDVTTVRASVGNYLISKYISENTECKVIFNGDGADEVMGGYLYFLKCPNELEFDLECRRLLKNIHYFDVLRSDRSISGNGLEPRTPFLDKNFVGMYLSIPSSKRFPLDTMEKSLFRDSVGVCDPTLLPSNILYRKKEAFSDGVSSEKKSWFSIIKESLNGITEKDYYFSVFDKHYPNQREVIPYYWMPKYSTTTDPSARTL
jgi:asparagine synthase (glutamine-hydrolysing)